MLRRFRSGKELPLGIAWEEDAIQVVDLQQSGAGYRVETLSSSLPGGSFAIDLINQRSSLVELLASIRKKNRWGKRNVVTALPSNQVLIRYLKLPALPAEKLEQEIDKEANEFLGNRLAEYSFDYMVLNRDEPDHDRQEITVMLAAIPREMALNLYELFSEAGFCLMAIDIIPLALKRALMGCRDGEQGKAPTVILDLGRNSTQLAIVAQGQLSLSRSLPFRFSPESEERTDKSCQNLLTKAKELLMEMQRSLDYFQAQSRQKAAELIVSGASCQWPDLISLLQELELRVVQGVPGYGLVMDRYPDPSFAVAVGLALKGVRA
ncbi:MAG: pilus assembly protein PilM [Clostridia bacterium]|nr:pilus assembly protein PilM [Clostridia bacterium]